MPFITHRGQRLHFTVEGEGPLVILQHGLLSTAAGWAASGYVAALADRYTVACTDSLGHGLSDKPAAPDRYGETQRADDLLAVIDALGHAQAHVVGYSMGAWMAIALARHHPERVASLTLGGWDCIGGMATAGGGVAPGLATILAASRAMVPELVAWVTPAAEPALQACWDAMQAVDGHAAFVASAPCPTLLWCGSDDPVYPPVAAFAAAHGLDLLTVPGNHATARTSHAQDSVAGIRRFLDQSRP